MQNLLCQRLCVQRNSAKLHPVNSGLVRTEALYNRHNYPRTKARRNWLVILMLLNSGEKPKASIRIAYCPTKGAGWTLIGRPSTLPHVWIACGSAWVKKQLHHQCMVLVQVGLCHWPIVRPLMTRATAREIVTHLWKLPDSYPRDLHTRGLGWIPCRCCDQHHSISQVHIPPKSRCSSWSPASHSLTLV